MNKWSFYTSNEIKPKGFLKRQLEIQAAGLAGNLDKVWRDIRNSKWIGGDADGWERVPYWLDGFVPLAYLLDDDDMKARADKYIKAIIENQQEDGWICPCKKEERPEYDTWVVQLITKVLTVYYDCTKDESVLDVIYKTLKNYYELLSSGEIKLYDWGKYRWFECFIAINLIYEKYGEQWLVDLAKLLKEQGADYESLKEKWTRPLNKWTFDTHIVNIAMMLKSEAVSCEVLGEKYTDKATALHALLEKYNATTTGLFTGDECLSGISPIQGTELCAVVEQMYSYEILFACTGEHKWAEKLESLAFNALPAAMTDDMWAHQYVQMSNQIACEKFPGKPIFRTNGCDAHIFGLEPYCGCCTSNHGQGFPKFILSAFMHDGETVINVLPIACELKTGGKHIVISSEYPFENDIKYKITTDEDFTFKIRIPSFAENVKINGKSFSGTEYTALVKKNTSIEISLAFEASPRFEKSPSGLTVAKCGSLLFSVPIEYKAVMLEYEKDGVEHKYPYCDYEYIPQSEWEYAYCDKPLVKMTSEISDIPFSSKTPPVTLRAKVKKINWGFEDGYETVCAKLPQSIQSVSDESEITLYPYGCAKLRMTELPVLCSAQLIIDK